MLSHHFLHSTQGHNEEAEIPGGHIRECLELLIMLITKLFFPENPFDSFLSHYG